MLKKSIFLCLLSSTLLAGIAFSQDFMFAPSIPTQHDEQDKTTEIMQEAPAQTPAAPAPLQLDRSGVDRASVHLQILQQSNQRFSDNAQTAPAPTKKTASDDKKSQAKSASST
ncbi:hypothetical protein ACO0LL_20175 [Undibacterium sp. TC4M20W]|uniref:hypothetical protein n=1 Tax=unclassified Undibacterium TaxID=2630295 RepID=UPI003BEF60C7